MKILVTGSSGFIGSAVCEKLLNNHTVYGIDNFSKYGEVSRPHDNHPNFDFVHGDCKNSTLMTSLLNKVDCVVHTAASIGGIKFWNTNSLEMLIENERITTTFFDSWLKSQTRPKVIMFSSSQVYENTSKFPSEEKDTDFIAPPTSAYGLQKLLLEKYTIDAGHLYNMDYTILRPFNAYGKGEFVVPGNNHVIVELIEKIKASDEIEIYGSGLQCRTFTYIDDVANAVDLCISNPISKFQTYNVCGLETVNVFELVDLIGKALNKTVKIKHTSTYDCDVNYRKGSIDLIQKELGWIPTLTLAQGLKKLVE